MVCVPSLGTVVLCEEHYKRRSRWCGQCFKDREFACLVRHMAARAALARAGDALRCAQAESHDALDHAWRVWQTANESLSRSPPSEAAGGTDGIEHNDDETTFPGVHATCRACRAERLWLGVLHVGPEFMGGAEALLGRTGDTFMPLDARVGSAVMAFVEFGVGTVRDVLTVARECAWLRSQTRWVELMEQALAARTFDAVNGLAAGGQYAVVKSGSSDTRAGYMLYDGLE